MEISERWTCKVCSYAITVYGWGNPWPKVNKHEEETGHVMDEVVENE